MIKNKLYLLVISSSLLLSSVSYADVIGSYAAKGILNVSFNKPNHRPVKTVSVLDEALVFNADQSFSRGNGLTGTWKQGHDKRVEVHYDPSAYVNHLSAFWADRGVNVSNIHILENKLIVQEVSNGLSGSELLKYSMDVSENGSLIATQVTVRGSFVAPNGLSENPALSELFPTMWQGQANTAASSVTTMVNVQPVFVFDGVQPISADLISTSPVQTQ